MEKRKLVAFDLDGTLLTTQKKILPSTIDALKKLREDGHVLTIATGRNRSLALSIIEALSFDHYILCNGAAAFVEGKQLVRQLLPKEPLLDFIEQVATLEIDTSFIGLDESKRASTFDLTRMEDAMQSFGSTAPDLDSSFIHTHDVYQALAFYDAMYEKAFHAEYPALDFIRWHKNCVDIVPKGSSKAVAINQMAQQYLIANEDIIVFGDGHNDQEMLRQAGTGVVMGNASDEVKLCGGFITRDNDNDGISYALQTLGLIKSM